MQACPLPVSISVGNRAFEEERARVSSVPVKCYNFYAVEGMKAYAGSSCWCSLKGLGVAGRGGGEG